MSLIYFSFFSLLALTVWVISWKFISREAHTLLLLYSSFYIVSTLIGATIIGLTDSSILDGFQWTWGLDIGRIKNTDTFKYWYVLYAPLVVTPLILLQVKHKNKYIQNFNLLSNTSQYSKLLNTDILSFSIALLILAIYCLFNMYKYGYSPSLANWKALGGDYQALIQARTAMISTLGGDFYGVVYMSLPTLSQMALYQAIKTKKDKIVWFFLFGLSFFIITVLSVSILQKAALLIYYLSLTVSLIILRVIKRWMFPIALPIVIWLFFYILNFLQSFMSNNWDSLQGLSLVFLRTASSFPFYINLYPDILPYSGIDIGLDMVGLDKYPSDNLIVFNYMYPSVTWIQGSVAAAAHVRAYSQGGLIYALFTLVLIGLVIRLLARLGKKLNQLQSPLLYSLYIQGGIISLYYINQGSIRDVLLVSYGVKWVLVGLFIGILCRFLFKLNKPKKTNKIFK
jgi:hypothetical protein